MSNDKMKAKPPKLTVTRFIAIVWVISMVAEIGLGFLYNPNIRMPISEQPYPFGIVFVSGFVMSLNLLLLVGCLKFFQHTITKLIFSLIISVGFFYLSVFILFVNFHAPPSLKAWLAWEMVLCVILALLLIAQVLIWLMRKFLER